MTATLQPLSPPHKGLRHAIGLVCFHAGKIDHLDLSSQVRLRRVADDLSRLLIDHEDNEEQFIFLPLSERCELDLSVWRTRHKGLATEQSSLLGRLRSVPPEGASYFYEQYLEVSRLQSKYLDLMFWEDVTLEPLMRQHFSDDELIGHQIAIMQKTPIDLLTLWFKYIVPARQLSENIQVLKAFRTSASSELFNQIMGQLQETVDAESLAALREAI